MQYVLLIMLSAAATIYAVKSFVERYRLRRKNEELKNHYELLKSSIQSEKNTKRVRYRVSHEQEKIDTIKRRLKENYGDRIILERKVLDEVIEYEKERAGHAKVKFDAVTGKNAGDFLLCFSVEELISFFVNLIDNAVEAAAKCEEGAFVRFELDKELLLENSICTENDSYDEHSAGAVLPGAGNTSKSEKEKHGFGLGIIEQLCRSKELEIEYTKQGKVLITKIQLGGGETRKNNLSNIDANFSNMNKKT